MVKAYDIEVLAWPERHWDAPVDFLPSTARRYRRLVEHLWHELSGAERDVLRRFKRAVLEPSSRCLLLHLRHWAGRAWLVMRWGGKLVRACDRERRLLAEAISDAEERTDPELLVQGLLLDEETPSPLTADALEAWLRRLSDETDLP